jgi:hypothetical protein
VASRVGKEHGAEVVESKRVEGLAAIDLNDTVIQALCICTFWLIQAKDSPLSGCPGLTGQDTQRLETFLLSPSQMAKDCAYNGESCASECHSCGTTCWRAEVWRRGLLHYHSQDATLAFPSKFGVPMAPQIFA